jgi:2-oxoglutarate dehydrogenase E1 component
MGEHTKFKRVYREVDPQIYENPDKVKRVVFCTGKIYYELADEREKLNRKDIAIVRIEQLAPFPWDKVAEECAHYKNAQIVWCQEEPKNMGAWSFVQPRIETATRGNYKYLLIVNTNTNLVTYLVVNGAEKRPIYAGRKPSAATATGLGARAHNAEQVLKLSLHPLLTSLSSSYYRVKF